MEKVSYEQQHRNEGNMVTVEHVCKSFKKETILEDVNMELHPGNIYGLVGPNGSGKTVLMKCICGLLLPTSGKVIVNGKIIGKDVDFPESLGIMIENPGFIPYLSGKSNLKNLALIRNRIGDPEIVETMKLVGLDPNSSKRVSKYSLGMRQRLGIAQAIMEDPDLLILDEPFNALDEQGVRQMHTIFLELKEKGKIILLAAHGKEDIRKLCDQVYYIEQKHIKLKNQGDDQE